MKKALSLMTAAALVLSLAACGSTASSAASSEAASPEAASSDAASSEAASSEAASETETAELSTVDHVHQRSLPPVRDDHRFRRI